ncbi:MAG: carbohydrate ABC transporter permease [Myxococcaceae bacterium]
MVAPAAVALIAVAAYPLLYSVWLSLHRLILVFHEQRFVGLDNYAFLLRDGRFWTALGNTLYFVVVAVAAEAALGLSFALLLDSTFRGRGVMRAAVLVPWAIPTVVSAKLWAWLFNPDYGLVTKVLPGQEVNWLGTPGYALHAAILVDVWKTTPFVALLLLAGLQGIPRDVYQAARVDGAGSLRIFGSITLPLLLPTLAVTLLFRALDAFRVFDAVYVLTGGGPANTSETLSVYAYKTLMRSGDFGYGSTLAVATFLCVAVLSVGYLRLMRVGRPA